MGYRGVCGSARIRSPGTGPGALGTAVLATWLAGALLTSCAPAGHAGAAGPSSAAPPATPGAPPGLVESPGPGWAPDEGLQGPVPPPGTCRARRAPAGGALPDASCTPGAVDAEVTQSDLAGTVCRAGGYAPTVRPPEAVTESFKAAAMRAYGAGGPLGSYELDHLVPLELGGSSDTRNLWPEPDDRPAPGVANSKDPVEDALHAMVCAAVLGRPYLPLVIAQHLIAADWTTALARARARLVGAAGP